MQTVWVDECKDTPEESFVVQLSESEAELLHRLAGKLSLQQKLGMGFTVKEAKVISGWYHGIEG